MYSALGTRRAQAPPGRSGEAEFEQSGEPAWSLTARLLCKPQHLRQVQVKPLL